MLSWSRTFPFTTRLLTNRVLIGFSRQQHIPEIWQELEDVPPDYKNYPKLKELQEKVKNSKSKQQYLCDYLKELLKHRQYESVRRYTSPYLITVFPRLFKNRFIYELEVLHKYSINKKPISTSETDYSQNVKSGRLIILCLFIVFFWHFVVVKVVYTSKKESNLKPKGPMSPKSIFKVLFSGTDDITEERNIKTRFSDVLGIDEFKEQLTELVDYIKHSDKYTSVGANLPKGILLVGPPGTGKTLMARALAGEAGCSFYYKSGSEFDEVFVGIGAKRVRQLFEKARRTAPSIIFIDEIDSVAGKRSAQGISHERDTINQLLSEMDGFKQTDKIIVIGATNLQKLLDPAIKRPGRFDKIIHVPLPDIKGRRQIFDYYLGKVEIEADVDRQMLARRTTGFSGADIESMVNVAILNAVKNNRNKAIKEDFEHAYDRILMGVGRKKMYVSKEEKLMTAYHEIGHALTSLLTPGASALHKVTILPRGEALGFTAMVPEKQTLNMNKKSILAHIDVCMGGRVAEQIFYGLDSVTTGCSNDLSKATSMAYSYMNSGMNEDVSLLSAPEGIKTSDKHNFEIDQHVELMLDQSYKRVKNLLRNYSYGIRKLAEKLAEEETLDVAQIKQLLKL